MITVVVAFLSRCIIFAVYKIAIFSRAIVIGLLNVAISARLKHASTDQQLLLPFVSSDMALERRNDHIGLCLKKIKFNKDCPLAYRKIQLSPFLALIIHVRELENFWVGFSRNSQHKVAIAIGHIQAHYYLVTPKNAAKFAFLDKFSTMEEETETNIEELSSVTAPFDDVAIDIDVEPAKPLVSKDVQKGIGKLLLDFAQTITIKVAKISILQQDFEYEQCLNWRTHYLTYQHQPGAYTVAIENLIVDFEDNNSEKKGLLDAHFTKKLSLSVGEKLELIRLAFEQDDGFVEVNLLGDALSELTSWSLIYQDKTTCNLPVTRQKPRKLANESMPFRLEIGFSAQVNITSLQKNIFRFCLSDMHICFDNIIDKNLYVARIGNFVVEITGIDEANATKFFVGMLECNLTRNQVVVALCEETILFFNNLPLVHICKGVQLQTEESESILIIWPEETLTHLKVSGEASLINRLTEHLGAVMRDLLDTILPNRLFIPGLAEARLEYHQRTDLPLSAEKGQKNKQDLPQQTAMLLSVAFAPSTCCRVEILLNNSHTLTSFSVLALEITSLEACFFALPSNIEQFCDKTLTCSYAINIEKITLRDSVEGSHWRHAFRSNSPVEIRYIQKITYLPTMLCEKKLGFYNNGEKIRFEAHLHEVFLRFIIDYYKEIISKDNPQEKGEKVTTKETLCWSLRFAPLALSISYKPATSHGSLVNSRFFDTSVPNISLSNATVNFKPYQSDLSHASFGAAMADYFKLCFPQLEIILLSASKALPVIQPIVLTATELASDLTNKNRTWKQTAARVTSNVVYGGTKLSVAAYKVARSTDRWLAKKQKSHLNTIVRQTRQPTSDSVDDDNDDYMQNNDIGQEPLTMIENYLEEKTPIKKISTLPKNGNDDENISIYANQPHSIRRALSDGATILQENAEIAFSALVTEPKRAFKYGTWQQGAVAALYGLPRAITRSATGLSGATVKLGHGFSNSIDKEKYKQRHNKWKSESYAK